MNKLVQQFNALVNQLQLFTGIHTAEAALIEAMDARITKLETGLTDLSEKHQQLHGRVVNVDNTVGDHLRNHALNK